MSEEVYEISVTCEVIHAALDKKMKLKEKYA